MRWLLYIALACVVPASAQEWNPDPTVQGGAIRFQDDLDFFLDGYTKPQIKAMRKQVSTWRMSFNKMMRATIHDIQAYSEGGGAEPATHDFTLADARTGAPYHLGGRQGRMRAFMFGSISNPPARAQLALWDKLLAKYDTAQVDLFVIYGRELHPGDKKTFAKYPAPATLEQKLAYARELAGLTALPVLVDAMDDHVFTAYGRVPNGAFVVDADGKLIFRSTWADSRKVEQVLDTVLKWYADGRPRQKAPQ